MSDSKEFTVDGKSYVVKRPSPKASQKAQNFYSIEFTKNIKSGLMTKAQMKTFLLEHGVWTKEKDIEEEKIAKKIQELELEIYRGNPNRKKITLKEGREKALEIKQERSKYMDLILQRQSYEANTAEALADNARFDFLVSECTFNSDGTRVYNSYEDYQVRGDESVAYEAASTLAQMVYALEDDYSKKLPENQFLLAFGLVDENLRLVNDKGDFVDSEYRKINEKGYYLDENNNRVDKFGNRLTEDGLFDLDVVYIDDNGKEIRPKSKPENEKDDKVSEEKAIEPVEEVVGSVEEKVEVVTEVKPEESNG
jgi:hypothetical protein